VEKWISDDSSTYPDDILDISPFEGKIPEIFIRARRRIVAESKLDGIWISTDCDEASGIFIKIDWITRVDTLF